VLATSVPQLGARQHGVLALGHLQALGLTTNAVQKRAAAGRLFRIHRGVYGLARPDPSRPVPSRSDPGPDPGLTPTVPAERRPIASAGVQPRRVVILEAAARLIARRGVRGLRMEELAAEAGVSTGLLYYHFTDRSTLLRRTLEFINERAGAYTEDRIPEAAPPRERLQRKLMLELQDDPVVVENSAAWGELRASALFEPELRETLRRSTAEWNAEIAALIDLAGDGKRSPASHDPLASAARLTALVEGLSQRWLSRSIELGEAQDLLRDAIAVELRGPA
jgi:AcrR family transcriptional regulator